MPRSVSKRRYERALRSAKAKARSELNSSPSQWWHYGFDKTFDLSPHCFQDSCPRLDATETSLEQFRDEFEKPSKPVVIVNDQLDWPATKKWTLERLAKKYRNQRFKCGEDDSGNSVKIKMKYFVQYMHDNQDDSPLYIFDANYGEHPKRRKLLDDYVISKFFPEDLFTYGSHRRRPPHRWCLFPPQTPKDLVKPRPNEGGLNKNEAIAWFAYVYPRTRLPDWPQPYEPIELLQRPGETVFIPGGWWHVVLNLTDTIAVTQNFCSSVNFPTVWHKTVRARPRFSKSWLAGLRVHQPHLADMTEKIDVSCPLDNFVVGSSSARTPQCRQKTSAKASRIIRLASTFCPAEQRPRISKRASYDCTDFDFAARLDAVGAATPPVALTITTRTVLNHILASLEWNISATSCFSVNVHESKKKPKAKHGDHIPDVMNPNVIYILNVQDMTVVPELNAGTLSKVLRFLNKQGSPYVSYPLFDAPYQLRHVELRPTAAHDPVV
ncbi:JmjC domain protein, partial [Opisthorchis viverrini]